jgi:hypothetical protein
MASRFVWTGALARPLITKRYNLADPVMKPASAKAQI